jgi:3-hydroxyacyl-CoA dehydrogenase
MAAIGVIGAGVMGSGIAQVAAAHGDLVLLLDSSDEVARKGIDGVAQALARS